MGWRWVGHCTWTLQAGRHMGSDSVGHCTSHCGPGASDPRTKRAHETESAHATTSARATSGGASYLSSAEALGYRNDRRGRGGGGYWNCGGRRRHNGANDGLGYTPQDKFWQYMNYVTYFRVVTGVG